MNKKVCHLSTVHSRSDVRIFWKECVGLSKSGFEVSLIVADGLGDETLENINIYDIGKEGSRISRIIKSAKKILKKAKSINADIYHFHDPELIPVGIKLLKSNKKVIYDVHEDVPRQILSKPYLNKILKPIIARIFEIYENSRSKKFSQIITSTDFIKDRFLKINSNSESIKNFPIIKEFDNDVQWKDKNNTACYLGSISRVRGIVEIIEALENNEYKLDLAGKFIDKELEKEVKLMPGWKNVNELGFVSRNEAKNILQNTKVGLVTLHPTINYKDALPVKMFEYMLAGIPVIASDIPLWKEIVEKYNCGLLVNPYKSDEISAAIKKLIENDDLSSEMGKNGKQAILKTLNWKNQLSKLITVYNTLK